MSACEFCEKGHTKIGQWHTWTAREGVWIREHWMKCGEQIPEPPTSQRETTK
jgi:hypothetical protein